MQKETTIKEKKLYMRRHFVIYQEFIQPFHLEYMILNRTTASA